ncbi:phage/plasmid primase, P4 family [Qipengyuania sp. CAU 1752]
MNRRDGSGEEPRGLQLALLVCGDEIKRLDGMFRAMSGKPVARRLPQPPYMKMLGLKLLDAGFKVVPVKPGKKRPIHSGWEQFAAKPLRVHAKLVEHNPKASIGIDCKKTPTLDIDCNDSELVSQLREELVRSFGPLLERSGRYPRICIPFRSATPFRKMTSSTWLDDHGREQKLEVLGHGQQFVAYGHHPDTGQPYTWYREGAHAVLHETPLENLPVLTGDMAWDLCDRFDVLAQAKGWTKNARRRGRRPRQTRNKTGPKSSSAKPRCRLELPTDEVRDLLRDIDVAAEYGRWIEVGMALHFEYDGADEGLALWKEWSSEAENYDEVVCDSKWPTFEAGEREDVITGKTLLRLAGRDAGENSPFSGLELSEDTVARAFAERHGETLRFDHELGGWMFFDGTAWRQDKTSLVQSWARDLCRDLREECSDQKTRHALARGSAVSAVERLARADRAFAVVSSLWDADKYLLGTPSGTVNLRTGKLAQARRKDYVTKVTSVSPLESIDPAIDMPVFSKFVSEVTSGDAEVVRFIQRFGGYCLTGDCREQKLLFIHGPGGNGKSLLQKVLVDIFGEYAWTAPGEMFVSSRGERHPTELAALRGRRLVAASENDGGKAWAETRIKLLSGGDKITARRMRQDFFEFENEAKLFFVGNNQPGLTHVDEAMKRRFQVLEFSFVPDQVDKSLSERIEPEYPAILRWLIDGCLAWQCDGLSRPDAMILATNEYFDEQDHVQEWLETRCELGEGYVASNEAIRRDYADFRGSKTLLPAAAPLRDLQKKGFKKIRYTHGLRARGILGLRLNNTVFDD